LRKRGKHRTILISIDSFGHSALGKVLFEKFGFNVENLVKKAKELLKNIPDKCIVIRNARKLI
jgi:transketolase